MSKAGEWSEVVTGSSPGSPETDDPQRISNNELAKRRILRVDPRSISDDVTRTPIQLEKTPNDSTPKTTAPAFLDPRSPTNELTRTPIILSHARPSLNLDQDDGEDSNLDTVAPPPSRGAVADLKDIEAKVESLQIKDDTEDDADEVYEKEEGEITNDVIGDEKNENHVPAAEEVENPVLRQLTPEPEFTVSEPKKTVEQKPEDYEEEDGEITHDSDDNDESNENVENLLKKTPVTIRSKSSLESDCRSPLLIESSEPVFGKALSNELALMAAKNNTPRQRKPLGEVKNDSNDDSLLI